MLTFRIALLSALFSAFSFLISIPSSGQNTVFEEIVLRGTGIGAKTLDQYIQALNSVLGVRIKFYCESTHTAVLVVNRSLQPGNENIIAALQPLAEDPAAVKVSDDSPDDIVTECKTMDVVYIKNSDTPQPQSGDEQ